MNKFKTNIFVVFILFIMPFLLVGCSDNNQTTQNNNEDNEVVVIDGSEETEEEEKNFKITDVNVGVLKGPTGMGMSLLMQQEEDEETYNVYHFTIADSPDVITTKLLNGELDVAAVPTNTAALLYNKTNGNIKIGAINTNGMLYILENGNTINSIKDLSGKTIYATGKGSVPQYVLEYILSENSIDDVTIEYKSDHSELSALMAAGEVVIGMLPEPQVTAAITKNPNLRIALDLTEEWNNVTNNMPLPMGCIVTTAEYADRHYRVFGQFLKEYKTSVEYVSEQPSEAAKLIEKFGILPNSEIAEKAIPNCNIVYTDGDIMKNSLDKFYSVLFDANSDSIGGTIPNDDIYFEPKK